MPWPICEDGGGFCCFFFLLFCSTFPHPRSRCWDEICTSPGQRTYHVLLINTVRPSNRVRSLSRLCCEMVANASCVCVCLMACNFNYQLLSISLSVWSVAWGMRKGAQPANGARLWYIFWPCHDAIIQCNNSSLWGRRYHHRRLCVVRR